jgi:hypothetical protein
VKHRLQRFDTEERAAIDRWNSSVDSTRARPARLTHASFERGMAELLL